ncbi:hypothetical protein CKO12_09350 [Chromatium okenii]|uniref:nucleotidyltransferase domain-containing protein n=1 Tax=Chromatium okenii TaxID=61644 RepID=UPI0019033BDF|nr:nucleotidyltransferase family protein [Chromatium okenii]MBK1642076.1 hypothetical protein [Chromatium okenii]
MLQNQSPAQYASALLINAVCEPQQLSKLSDCDWDLLLQVARQKRLLGRLYMELKRLCLLSSVPENVAAQLRAANNLVTHRQTVLAWELNRILWALKGLDVPVIALKGIAYVIADLPPASGRFFADLDILVPLEHITVVEQRLLDRGWLKTTLSPYDERYYRLWMHEIPPLRHRERESEIDIHHTLLPRTHRFNFHAITASLFTEAHTVPNSEAQILAAPDMVLHVLVHLLFEGNPEEGLRLRDLIDIADLLRYFGSEMTFWSQLVQRAEQLNLGRPLYYGFRYLQRLLGIKVPAFAIQTTARFAPIAPIQWLMDWLVPLAILPEHPAYPRYRARLARQLLYLRAHWLRMPPLLLIRHLSYKMWLRLRKVPRYIDIKPQDLQQL